MPSLQTTSKARAASLLAVLALGGGASVIAGCGGSSEPASDSETQTSTLRGETNPNVDNPAIPDDGEATDAMPSDTGPGSTTAPGGTSTVPGGSPSASSAAPGSTSTTTTPQANGGHAAPDDNGGTPGDGGTSTTGGGSSGGASGDDGNATSTTKSGASQDPDCRPGTGPGQADPQCEPVSGPDAQDEDG